MNIDVNKPTEENNNVEKNGNPHNNEDKSHEKKLLIDPNMSNNLTIGLNENLKVDDFFVSNPAPDNFLKGK